MAKRKKVLWLLLDNAVQLTHHFNFSLNKTKKHLFLLPLYAVKQHKQIVEEWIFFPLKEQPV